MISFVFNFQKIRYKIKSQQKYEYFASPYRFIQVKKAWLNAVHENRALYIQYIQITGNITSTTEAKYVERKKKKKILGIKQNLWSHRK